MEGAQPRPRPGTYLIFATEFQELQRIAHIDARTRVDEMLRQVENIVGPTGHRLIVADAMLHDGPLARAIEHVNERLVWGYITARTQDLVRGAMIIKRDEAENAAAAIDNDGMDGPGGGAVYRPQLDGRDDPNGSWAALQAYDPTRDNMDGLGSAVYPLDEGRGPGELWEARLTNQERERKHWIEHIKQASKEHETLAREITEQARKHAQTQALQAARQQRQPGHGHRQEKQAPDQDMNPSQPKQPTQPRLTQERADPRTRTGHTRGR